MGACWKKANMTTWWPATAGMRASGATSNWRRASMQLDAISVSEAPDPGPGRRTLYDGAATLLLRAAAPERLHLLRGVAWLMLAAGLEALGPLVGKFLIDNYLL